MGVLTGREHLENWAAVSSSIICDRLTDPPEQSHEEAYIFLLRNVMAPVIDQLVHRACTNKHITPSVSTFLFFSYPGPVLANEIVSREKTSFLIKKTAFLIKKKAFLVSLAHLRTPRRSSCIRRPHSRATP
jgi:hypothetical protein